MYYLIIFLHNYVSVNTDCKFKKKKKKLNYVINYNMLYTVEPRRVIK